MKKILVSLVLLLNVALGALQAEDLKTGPWFNHYVNGINRLPARVTSYSYQSEADALTYNRDLSRMASLNGTWKFMFVDDISKAPLDFYKAGYDVASWGEIQVPSCWEMQGHGYAIYRNTQYFGRLRKRGICTNRRERTLTALAIRQCALRYVN